MKFCAVVFWMLGVLGVFVGGDVCLWGVCVLLFVWNCLIFFSDFFILGIIYVGELGMGGEG